jgi:plasmid stabilization system protein ParE
MPELRWTAKARQDLERLYEFLAPENPRAAARTIQALVNAPVRLLDFPRIGERLDEFGTREVRRIILKTYEIRYEVKGPILYVLRIWHTREER